MIGTAWTLALAIQSASWIAPVCDVDEPYLTSAKQLIGSFLGDVRGLPYMRVEVDLGRIDEDGFPFGRLKQTGAAHFKVEGWVQKGEPLRAVLWDGIAYPVRKVLGQGDMEKRRHALLTGRSAFPEYDRINVGFHRGLFEVDGPAAPALWLMAGEVKAAEGAFRTGRMREDLIPWLLRRYLTYAFYDIRNGDLKSALNWLDRDLELREQTHSETTGIYNLSDDAIALVDDLRERMAAPKIDPGSLSAGDLSRVRCELAGVRNFYAGFGPGPIDPRIKEVVDRGEAVVPALLSLRHLDDRFTLASYPSRNFPGPNFAPISLAARYALELMWPEYPMLESKQDDELVRLYAHQKGLSTAERLVEICEDLSLPISSATQALGRLSPTYGWFPQAHLRLQNKLESARLFTRIVQAADVRAIKAISEINQKEGNKLFFAHYFQAAYGAWDYQAAKPMVDKLTRMVLPLLDRDNELYGESWNTAFDLVGMGLRNGDVNAATTLKDITVKKSSSEHWFQVIACSAQAGDQESVSSTVRDFIIRTNPDFQQARAWLVRIAGINGYWWQQVMASGPFRDWLAQCLHNTSYELAEGGPSYLLSTPGYRVEFRPHRKGPEFIRLRVADFVAQVLFDKFDTGVAFDVFAPEEVKEGQRKALREWLRKLPPGPVKEYQSWESKPSFKRASTPKRHN